MDEELGRWRMIKVRTVVLYRKLEVLEHVMESRRGSMNACRRGIIQAEAKELYKSKVDQKQMIKRGLEKVRMTQEEGHFYSPQLGGQLNLVGHNQGRPDDRLVPN